MVIRRLQWINLAKTATYGQGIQTLLAFVLISVLRRAQYLCTGRLVTSALTRDVLAIALLEQGKMEFALDRMLIDITICIDSMVS